MLIDLDELFVFFPVMSLRVVSQGGKKCYDAFGLTRFAGSLLMPRSKFFVNIAMPALVLNSI